MEVFRMVNRGCCMGDAGVTYFQECATTLTNNETTLTFQSKLLPGATILGTILSSDKTNISALIGGRTVHPLLLSLANIDMECRMHSSNHAFVLLAILPEARFIAPEEVQGVLGNRLFHECMDFVVEPLKTAARIGIMMSNPVGNQ